MILPDFAQRQVREEVDIYPVVVLIDTPTRHHAVEVHIELEVFTKGVQGTGYTCLYLDATEMVLKDVLNYCEDLLCYHLDEISICFHQWPYLVRKSENNMAVRNPEEMAAYPLCPILSQPPATGRAQTAVAAAVDCLFLATLRADEGDIALAWIMAEEHCL
jgi:hypothetical protein